MALELASDRLVLRPHALADVDECAAMWADAEVTKHIGGKPFTREETWARVLRYAGHWQLLGFGFFCVRERSSGKFVGDVGIADFHREISPALDEPEAGWALASWAHGKGYATEALRTLLAWGDARFARTACMIDVDNSRSFALAARCGYRESHRARNHGADVVVLVRDRA
jgi:RimJ/RimL family protein N-acetyltransferase